MRELTSIERVTRTLALEPVDHVAAAVSPWGSTTKRWRSEVDAKVQIRVEMSKGWLVDWPVIETPDEIMIFCS